MIKKNFTVKTKYGSFVCIFEPEEDMGGYMAEARGVRGAVSWGGTLREAKHKIVEAIEGAIEASIVVKAERDGIVLIKDRKRPILIA